MMRKVLAAAALALGLSACQVTVTYTTQLAEDGSGVFSVALALDEDAVTQIGDEPPALLTRLEEIGWAVAVTEPVDGGVAFELSRSFANPDELSEVFDELRDARTGGGVGDFEGIDLQLEITSEPGAVSSQYGIDGSIDFGIIDELPPESLAELNRGVVFEIVADLPGDARVSEGDATLDEQGRVVWRPLLGEEMTFAASSTVREPTLFIGILLGGIGLGLAVLAGIVRQRRLHRRRTRLSSLTIERSTVPAFDVEAAAARVQAQPRLDEFEFDAPPMEIEPAFETHPGDEPEAMFETHPGDERPSAFDGQETLAAEAAFEPQPWLEPDPEPEPAYEPEPPYEPEVRPEERPGSAS